MIHVLVDDVRDLFGMDIICRNPTVAWDVCKNITQEWSLYLDHDLGAVVNGNDVLKNLIEMRKAPKYVQIVSSNPVGVANIKATLEAEGYVKSDLTGINYERA